MRNVKDEIPEVGKSFYCYDDGKMNDSRKYTVHINEVVSFSSIDKSTLSVWEKEVEGCPWLYAGSTDFFVHGLRASGDIEVFVRTLDGGWFGIGGMFCCGRLTQREALNC